MILFIPSTQYQTWPATPAMNDVEHLVYMRLERQP